VEWNSLAPQDGDCLLFWVDRSSNPTRTTESYLKRIISTNTVVPPDEGPRYGRNK
jgi:hypothetical protein